MNLEEIRELVKLMKENGLTEIDIASEGGHVRLRAENPPAMVYQTVPAAPPLLTQSAGVTAAEAPAPAEPAAGEVRSVVIKSPIVGTLYHAPAPDKAPFVQAGDMIDENSVLCVIEAMKVMNEIKAEMRGVVREILAQNGQPVEFGQPLFAIEPIP